MDVSPAPPTILLSGDRGRGKSTVVANVAARMGERLGGVLSRRVEGGLEAVLLPEFGVPGTGRLPLAYTHERPGHVLPSTTIGPYSFVNATIDAVNTHLRDLVAKMVPALVIDEVGPLELIREEGFRPGLDQLLESRHFLIIVIRPELIETLSDIIREKGRNILKVIDDPRPTEKTVALILAYIASFT